MNGYQPAEINARSVGQPGHNRLLIEFVLVTMVLMSVPAPAFAAFASDCARFIGEIPWLLKLDDDAGSCRMEDPPVNGEYPSQAIPNRLRNGREICTRRGTELDRVFQWKEGRRISVSYYGSRLFQDPAMLMKLELFDSSIPSGPVRAFYGGELACEIPLTPGGKVTGTVREYHANGRLAREARLFDGKEQGAAVRYDDRGKVTSFTCEGRPVFAGDRERCGFNGRPATVELVHGGRLRRILTHFQGKLTAEEEISRNGERVVKRYTGGDNRTVQVEEFYKNGRPHRRYAKIGGELEGPYLEFHKNGRRAEEGRAEKGKTVLFTKYYLNGAQKIDAAVLPGGSLCAVRLFSLTGTLLLEGIFKTNSGAVAWDTPHGHVRSFQEDGTLAREGDYLDGTPNGSHNFYLEGGKRAEVVFEKGKPLRLREFATGGAQIGESEIDDGSIRSLLRRPGNYF